MPVSTDYINTGGGKLYIEQFVNGAPSGDLAYFGITENVNLTTAVEFIDHKNTETKTTKTDKKVQKSVSATINFATAEISLAQMARAYGGTVTANAQTAYTDEAVTITGAKAGYYYPIGIRNITSLIVKDVTDTTTYVINDDYTYDASTGMLYIVDGGAITSEDLHLTVSADAFADGAIMGAFLESQLEAKLVFISDPLAGKRFVYTFKKVAISGTGDQALKSEDFATITFEGTALVDDTVTDPTLSDYFDVEEIPA